MGVGSVVGGLDSVVISADASRVLVLVTTLVSVLSASVVVITSSVVDFSVEDGSSAVDEICSSVVVDEGGSSVVLGGCSVVVVDVGSSTLVELGSSRLVVVSGGEGSLTVVLVSGGGSAVFSFVVSWGGGSDTVVGASPPSSPSVWVGPGSSLGSLVVGGAGLLTDELDMATR